MRPFERTHPWLKFHFDTGTIAPNTWIALGEAQSKCEHISDVPLRPGEREQLHEMYFAKGIAATAAIEGNTLTFEQVQARMKGMKDLPASLEYQGKEIDNLIDVSNSILDAVTNGEFFPLNPELLRQYNAQILRDLELPDYAVAGEYRSVQVGAHRYLAAPAEDCPYLVEKFCEWMNGPDFKPISGKRIISSIIKAIIGHVYFVWIHPFGEGNGRTARLLEMRFLLESGIPSVAAQLLSNHYNYTRNEYYQQLDYASKSGGDLSKFMEYAVVGFVDQLREEIAVIKQQSWEITWDNFVHHQLRRFPPNIMRRRRILVLELSWKEKPTRYTDIETLNPELAKAYANKQKTKTRDLNELVNQGLLRKGPGGYKAATDVVLSLLPRRLEIDSNLP